MQCLRRADWPHDAIDLDFDIELWGAGRAGWREGRLVELVDVAGL
jgi:hypothetical protein